MTDSVLAESPACVFSGTMSNMIPQVYDSPIFRMACQQFDLVADFLEIPECSRDRLKMPKRAVSVAMPVRMDDNCTKVFMGYRVQHHLTLGPTKGGTRFHPDVTLGEVAALAITLHTSLIKSAVRDVLDR